MRLHLLVKHNHRNKKKVSHLIAALQEICDVRYVEADSIEATQSDLKANYKTEDILLVIGGDGTLHYSVQALDRYFKTDSLKPTLAVFPYGTGNDFARAFSIPKNVKRWLEMFNQKHFCKIDLGFIESPHNRYYLCCASFGVSALASELAHKPSFLPSRIKYLLATAVALMRLEKFDLTLNRADTHRQTLHAVFANTKFFGSGIVAAKHAMPSDGQQNFVGLTGSLAYAVANIFAVLRGDVFRLKGVCSLDTDTLEIETEKPVPIQADGEMIGYTPARLKTIKEALNLLVPLP